MAHTVDKLALIEFANEKINSTCSLLTNMFDGGLNVSEDDISKTQAVIDKMRDAQSELLSLLKAL